MPRPTKRGDGDGHSPVLVVPLPTVEQQFARIDAAMVEIQHTLDVQFKRIAAMQAQLDHLAARTNS